ncbi:putative leader peptide [Actinomycetospora atypica]|uniref:Leader peptide n=1 Tax=Actinomycetospora atypica TaxID=1290095 RepID=A0ABV9YE40_9PSEU
MRECEQAPALRCTRSSFVGCYRRHVDLQRVASAVCPA